MGHFSVVQNSVGYIMYYQSCAVLAKRCRLSGPDELRQRLPDLHEEERVHPLLHIRLRHGHARVPQEGAVNGSWVI